MHILQVAPYFYPAWAYGGIPRLLYGLSRALVGAGHTVTVITTDVLDATHRLPSSTRSRLQEGVRVITLRNVSNALAYHHQGFIPLGFSKAMEGLAGQLPDVVHLHGHRHLLNNLACVWARQQGRSLVMTPNGTLPAIERKVGVKHLFDLLLGQRVLDAVSEFVAVSRAEIAQFRRHQIPAERISLIPNGLDLAEFEHLPPRGLFKQRHGIVGPMVLYLGKLTPRKGVDHLLEAFATLKRRDVTLVIAGNDMGVEAALRAHARRLELHDRVRFVGLLTGEQRLAALADAEVLAYPSSLEIFGLVPFEGLLAGAPVVVGDDCGCGEVVQEARAGLLVPFGVPAALAIALEQLLDRPAQREELVARGRAFIRGRLSWERLVPQTLDVYQRAISAGPRG